MILARLTLALGAVAALNGAETARYFDPWHATGAAIAPDGRHLAYLRWAGEHQSEVIVVDCDHPASSVSAILPQHLRFFGAGSQRLEWLNPGQVKIQTNVREVWAVSLSGKAVRIENATGPAAARTAAPEREVQRALDRKFSDRTVEISGWDDAHRRAILLVASPEDAGRYFLYDRDLDQLTEFVRRAPQLTRADLATVRRFSVRTGSTGFATALLAEPRARSAEPVPLVILCRGEAPRSEPPNFEPELHALAAAGYAVIEFSPQLPPSDVDRLSRALANLLPHFSLLASKVAIVGMGEGAVLAARAVASHPEQFCCGAAIDGPLPFGPSGSRPMLRARTEDGQVGSAFPSVIAFLRQKL